MSVRYIYIMISRTRTGFGRLLRYVGRMQYNHSSISLDEDFKELYAFSRPKHHALFTGRLVRETLDRYTLKKGHMIPVTVFQLQITQEQHDKIRCMIEEISQDPEYMYNLFSVLTYPITKGFETYKSYNCTEFVAHTLKELNFPLEKPAYSYKPDDFLQILSPYIVYQGDIKGYMRCLDTDEQYFEHINIHMILENIMGLFRIFGRTYFS